MPKSRNNKKGVILFIVLGMLLVLTLLASVVLRFTASHYRLTRHEISRIQAYYAAQAGINYAVEMLRVGSWSVSSCPSPGCDLPNDSNFPDSVVQPVKIIIIPAGSPGCNPPGGSTACVSVTTIYTYSPT